MNLPKPLAVMHRQPMPTAEDSDMDIDHDSQFTNNPGVPPQWDIVAVVKRKMVFAKRPMPMVGRPPVSEGSTKS